MKHVKRGNITQHLNILSQRWFLPPQNKHHIVDCIPMIYSEVFFPQLHEEAGGIKKCLVIYIPPKASRINTLSPYAEG